MDINRHLHVLGATSTARSETLDGREWLVVPVVALMEGVIHAVNAETPEFVPATALADNPSSWDGLPLVVGHPVKDGVQISAKTPGELERRGFGVIKSTRFMNGKLGLEAWADITRLEVLGHQQMLADMRAGKPIEVSVGAHVHTRETKGAHRGKQYAAEWTAINGDHLAFLPGGRGACSVDMGCGTGRMAMRMCDDHMELETLEVGKTTMNKSLRERMLALVTAFRAGGSMFDTPEQAASEEKAEDVAYKVMRLELDQAGTAWDEASGLINDLIADQKTPDTGTTAEESETEIEQARLEAILSLCMGMYGSLNGVMDAARREMNGGVSMPERYMAQKDCTVCEGKGKVNEKDCAACDGLGQMKAAAGRRNSASDMKMIQSVHDHTVSLGADCTPGNYKVAAAVVPLMDCPTCGGKGSLNDDNCTACGGTGKLKTAAAMPQLRAACSCEENGMNKEQKAEVIAALVTDKHSGYREGDEPFLNALSDARLEEFKAAAAANKLAVEAKDKADDDLRAANAKVTVLEGKLKTAEQAPSEEEWLAKAPSGIKALLDHQKAQEAEEREGLIKTLKAVGANTEDELKAMLTPQLKTLAAYAKIKQPDFSGRGIPVDRTAGEAEDFTPPDAYAAELKTLREKVN